MSAHTTSSRPRGPSSGIQTPRSTIPRCSWVQASGGILPLDVLMELARECKRTSQKATAKRLGFTPQFINDVLNGRRKITDNLAAKMGYQRVTRFVREVPHA